MKVPEQGKVPGRNDPARVTGTVPKCKKCGALDYHPRPTGEIVCRECGTIYKAKAPTVPGVESMTAAAQVLEDVRRDLNDYVPYTTQEELLMKGLLDTDTTIPRPRLRVNCSDCSIWNRPEPSRGNNSTVLCVNACRGRIWAQRNSSMPSPSSRSHP